MNKAALLLVLGTGGVAGWTPPPEVGRPAPEIELRALDGDRVRLADYRGRPVLLNFWASWCRPCRDELPEIVRRYRELSPAGLEVLAINLTDQEREEELHAFVAEQRLPFRVLLDVRGKARRRYRLTGLPTTVFVDSRGTVTAVHTGPLSRRALDEGLATIIAPQAGR
jgi:peroxiredoxin